ncbi:MAG: hypothetical protein DCC67_12635 [Planctomycetota bacterium]|nr:MAG: hypothetical protein DCC67_12635 [Planctomycetota bacterium]
MVLAFHSIFTAYGFWLPNEPRGSWSDYVGAWELRNFGPATKVSTRRSIAARPYDRALKARMQSALQFEPVRFSGEQAREIVRGFADSPYVLHACAVLPEHVHLVIAHTDRDIRTVVGHLKSSATKALREHGWFLDHTPWADHGWNVYLNTPADVDRAIAYVENNPVREGKRRQQWRCVVPFDPRTSRAGAL